VHAIWQHRDPEWESLRDYRPWQELMKPEGWVNETVNLTGLGFCIHDSAGHRLEPGDALLPLMTQEELDSIPWR
jgi:hypothetical protein